ncbi:MAG: response regulator [Lachnospiraceae bacterium]|nr:response regulator [Lachnospiraceae bacterium]
MLKVFLVEDEFIVRQGIKNNIDWKAHGYDFCGEASDGEVAFPMIQKLRPDIVITDIKMPFMDGLALSKLIKKELPWTEIIILTGHEKFEYAKEALKIGVAEYLSKPISGDELLREVGVLAEKIEEKRKERAIKEKYTTEMEENFLKDRKDLFQYMVLGSKTMPELLEVAGELGVDLSAMWYNIVLLHIKSSRHAKDEYSNSIVKIEADIKNLEKENSILFFDRNLEGSAILFKADSKEELQQLQESVILNIEGILNQYKNVQYFGGIGEPVNRLSELPVSFERASRAFAHRYFVEDNCIIDNNDMQKNAYVENDEFNIVNVDTKQIDRTKIKEFLKIGVKDDVVYFVDEFVRGLNKGAMESNIFRQYITMDAYFSVVDFVESIQMPKEEIETLDIASNVLKSVENASAYMIRIIKQAIELRDKASSNKYGNIVDDIMKYIEENYANDDLSLNVVASHVNFSPNHLSAVFSQQTGQTFIKYLTDYRMNKAKELLRCSSDKSSDIALAVGYKDPHYFSYLFKKTQNMTPTQYRGGKSSEGEE